MPPFAVKKAALWLLSFVVFSCMAVAVPMGSSAVEPAVFVGVCAFLFCVCGLRASEWVHMYRIQQTHTPTHDMQI